MATLNLSPSLLEWAADKLGTTLDGLAESMAARSKQDDFKDGALTLTQARELAKSLNMPFGYLFLDRPPRIDRPSLPDLRQTVHPEPLGDNFYDLLGDIQRKLDWFSQQLKASDISGPSFVGKYYADRRRVQPKVVARDITQVIKLTSAARNACKTTESFYNWLSARFDDSGVLVFRSGVAKGNSHRPLPVSEFRGFAIADPLTPAIFINGRDTPSAWIFTLIHEAAHLWIGETGVSDTSASTTFETRGVEALCNRIAAEVLTPEDEFLDRWTRSPSDKIVNLARHFRVSRLVVARRALDVNLISKDEYQAVAAASDKPRTESGGNPYATIPVRSSRLFTEMVLHSAMSGETLLRDAGKLLNVNPGTVVELYRRHQSSSQKGRATFD